MFLHRLERALSVLRKTSGPLLIAVTTRAVGCERSSLKKTSTYPGYGPPPPGYQQPPPGYQQQPRGYPPGPYAQPTGPGQPAPAQTGYPPAPPPQNRPAANTPPPPAPPAQPPPP